MEGRDNLLAPLTDAQRQASSRKRRAAEIQQLREDNGEMLRILSAILYADERGQGVNFYEAMTRAKRMVESRHGPT